MESHAVLIAEITDLKARLAQSEAVSEGRLKVLNEKAEELRKEWKRAEAAEAALREERSKREEAERALATVRSGMIGLAEVIAAVPGVFPCLNALLDLVREIPTPKPAQEGADGNV